MSDKPTHIRITKLTPDAQNLTEGSVYAVQSWDGGSPCIFTDDGRHTWLEETAFLTYHGNPDTPATRPWEHAPAASGSVAHSILTEAAGIVQGDRNATHGDKERSFQVIADLWNAYQEGRKVQGPLVPRDVAQMMVLLKIARTIQGTAVRDHFTDAAGYSAIAGELE